MRRGPGQTWARLAVLGENNAQFLELDPDIPAAMRIVREKLRFVSVHSITSIPPGRWWNRQL